MDKKVYALLENYMLSSMEDSAHDKDHVYRVLYSALEIAKSEADVDYDVLIAACLLHDIGRKEQLADPKLCHAAVGSEKAFKFLMENGITAEFAAKVKDCIRTHRFRKGTVSDPLYSLLPDGSVSDGTNDKTPSFFQEYKFKLENLYSNFYTEKGKKMALERRSAAVAFYESLYKEMCNSYEGKDELEKHII